MGRESSLPFLSFKGSTEDGCCSESKTHKAVTGLPVSSPSQVPAVSSPLHVAVSKKPISLSSYSLEICLPHLSKCRAT